MTERFVSLHQYQCALILFGAVITSCNSLDALVFHSISPLDIITRFKLCKYMKQKSMNDIEPVASGTKEEIQRSVCSMSWF